MLRSAWVGMGPEVAAFERELGEFVGASVATVSSCTAGLHLILSAIGVGPGDEVICPSLTWCSSANAALYLGADVVFADVDPDTLCVTPESVAAAVSGRTKAVVVVHFGGLAADVAGIRDAMPDGVTVVEDAAHALGAAYADGRPVGSSGNPTAFSFYANKNLSTAEGGAVATTDPDLLHAVRGLRQHGYEDNAWKRFSDPAKVSLDPLRTLGFKANYTDLQAAVGRVQLARFPRLQERRRDVAVYYEDRLRDAPLPLRTQSDVTADAHARHLFTVLLPLEEMNCGRDEILLSLREDGIGATVHYTPLHRMPLYAACRRGDLTQTDFVGDRVMTLPISATVTPADAQRVCDRLFARLETAGA